LHLYPATIGVSAVGCRPSQRAAGPLENTLMRSANQQLGMLNLQQRTKANWTQILQSFRHISEDWNANLLNHPLSLHGDFIAQKKPSCEMITSQRRTALFKRCASARPTWSNWSISSSSDKHTCRTRSREQASRWHGWQKRAVCNLNGGTIYG
jgi:hypothetical protein